MFINDFNFDQWWKRNFLKDSLFYMIGVNTSLKIDKVLNHIDLFKTEKYKNTDDNQIKYFLKDNNSYIVVNKSIKDINLSFEFGPEELEAYEISRLFVYPLNSSINFFKTGTIKKLTNLSPGKNRYQISISYPQDAKFKEEYFAFSLNKYNRLNSTKITSKDMIFVKIINSDYIDPTIRMTIDGVLIVDEPITV